MNRSTTRRHVAAAGLAACGLILSGCGTGQITQTSTQESGVNGAAADLGDIALRNVYLQAVQRGDFLQPGSTVRLMMVAANNSPDTADKLVAVTSDVGQVKLSGDGVIPAGRALVVGGSDGAVTPMGTTVPATAEVILSRPITNGLSYTFTFDFEKAGRASVAVPISAGD